jgi:E3 ubiquitin-protein ligase BIG BROTHER-like protein
MLQEQENAWQFSSSSNPANAHASPYSYGLSRSSSQAQVETVAVVGVDATEGEGDEDEDEDTRLARQLMMEEEQAFQLRLQQMAGIVSVPGVEVPDGVEVSEEDVGESQEEDEEGAADDSIDPDRMTYEQLIALGDVVGKHQCGLDAKALASLQRSTFQSPSAESRRESWNAPMCLVCRLEFESGDEQVLLPCGHAYHEECIMPWFEPPQSNKTCPTCKQEVAPA